MCREACDATSPPLHHALGHETQRDMIQCPAGAFFTAPGTRVKRRVQGTAGMWSSLVVRFGVGSLHKYSDMAADPFRTSSTQRMAPPSDAVHQPPMIPNRLLHCPSHRGMRRAAVSCSTATPADGGIAAFRGVRGGEDARSPGGLLCGREGAWTMFEVRHLKPPPPPALHGQTRRPAGPCLALRLLSPLRRSGGPVHRTPPVRERGPPERQPPGGPAVTPPHPTPRADPCLTGVLWGGGGGTKNGPTQFFRQFI